MRALGQSLFGRRRRAASRVIEALPPYQVALWPDGWENLPDGAVLVCDTDAMAEARRWYAMSERNGSAVPADRAMRLHHAFVPRAVVALSRLRFGSEQAASVAVQLVAGEWIRQRRSQMLEAPEQALGERRLTWSGSRFGEVGNGEAMEALVRDLVALCVAEGLIPSIVYRIRIRPNNGFGISGLRCIIESDLGLDAQARLSDLLSAALVPWNRAVAREYRPYPVIGLEIRRLPGAI